ncbi:L-threonylcarbamoyladenylate synthase [Hydrogenophaga sp.]|uniref:L-threonylcarbamoyladenylate synthase n=1 Tax=Hydrogenophaga sp. TaxID=1904254 RepID=UPI002626B8F1|nr:L-threonylcarbamoyladenylate synthase [Hydrogenophaga sp.]MDM7951343.1 L-threonylcarbamoyladenylate synthase [Hydrogenophaga sp.]
MPLRLQSGAAGAIEAAAQRLAAGGLVGMPTETVYGLAARADDAQAVRRIFAAKGRPADHPLIVHLAPATIAGAPGWRDAVAPFASQVPEFAVALMQACWPGPLTLILPRRPEVAAAAAGGQDSIGLRCPAHPVAQSLLIAAQAAGVAGVAAPSANRFGRVSPTTAQHVSEEFADLGYDELLILDGGACPVGIESTIVDATRGAPVLLRPGAITAAQIEAITGLSLKLRDEASPRASGTLASHYAPRAKVRLMPAQQLQAALDVLGADAKNIAVYARTALRAGRGVVLRRMPDDAQRAAHELFAVMRELDATGVPLIWVETPPADSAWAGVSDRLHRAAA